MKHPAKKSKLLQSNQYYWMLLLPVLYYAVFKLLPLGGLIIAWRRYVPAGSIFGQKWMGATYFKFFLNSPIFWRALRNNLVISFTSLLVCFPIGILFALLLNEVRSLRYKSLAQTMSYLPNFLSMVVVCGMIKTLLSPSNALYSSVMHFLGFTGDVHIINNPNAFLGIYIISDIWQWTGASAIIFIAAISGIDPILYEAAVIDGANRFDRARYVTLPCIAPTIVISLILRVGNILEVGFEKILLLSSPLTLSKADVISTFVYRAAFESGNYSYATAVGLSNSLISLLLIVSANLIARRVAGESLW